VFLPRIVAAAPPTPSEYQIKAAFLYNFAKFVEWPSQKFTNDKAPIIVGLIGKDPFGPDLEKTIQSESVGGRPLVIKRFDDPKEVAGCHLLFVGLTDRRRLNEVLSLAQTNHVLAVGEADRFAEQGGIINFITVDKKVRFEINVEAAKKSDLKISSKLLNLAKVVGSEK